MKSHIRNILSRAGILPTVDLARRLPEIAAWLRQGCVGVAPAPVKRLVLSAYLKKYSISNFVETGTHLGDTLAFVARDRNVAATSIELDEQYFSAASGRFAAYPNVTLLQGDSGKVLPSLVERIKAPTLFWLDGHYSGAGTGRGELDTPVSAELESILSSSVNGHVVLIDDARLFNGEDDYPHLDRLLELVRENGKFEIEVSTDIVRLTPVTPGHAQ